MKASGKELMFKGAGKCRIECNGACAGDKGVCEGGIRGGTRCGKSRAKTVMKEANVRAAKTSSEPCTSRDEKAKTVMKVTNYL